MLWAVANTLTVFAIRNVGLSIAFPLWNTNSLVGLFWGWLLFNELRGAGRRDSGQGVWAARRPIVVGACLLAYATSHSSAARQQGDRWASSRPSARGCSGERCTSRTARPTSAA